MTLAHFYYSFVNSGMAWKDWPERVRAAFEGLGITQTEFGRRVGEKKGVIGNWLHGHTEPSLAQFERIATVTNKSLLWLVLGHDCDAAAAAPDDLRRETVYLVTKAILTVISRQQVPQIVPGELASIITAIADARRGRPEAEIMEAVESVYFSVYGRLLA